MKINFIQPILNTESFYNFVKLDQIQKLRLLKEQGIFLDSDNEKDTITKLYFLNGFFVEEILSRKDQEIVDIIPYKQGYKIENYLKERIFLNWLFFSKNYKKQKSKNSYTWNK